MKKKVDVATGQLFPMYDEGTNTLLLSGRGDTTIRIFEMGPSLDKLSHCRLEQGSGVVGSCPRRKVSAGVGRSRRERSKEA